MASSPIVAAPVTLPKSSAVDAPESLYEEYERLQERINHLELKTMICKTETHQLKKEESTAKQEVKRIQAVPLVLANFVEAVDSSRAIVSGTLGTQYFVKLLSTLNKELLKPNTSVGLHKQSNACVRILPSETDPAVSLLRASERPDISYADIGGLDVQKQEIREAVELPLTDPGLYHQIGIDPPRGVLLYGPPGTGKTMLVQAVAHHTEASFIRVSANQFVQKFLGEGARKVRDAFRLARENAPSIIFIDEVDCIASKRFDAQTGADREVQRVLVELLTQMDGFDQSVNVKVIMATNRWDQLDPAILRPGRLDRKIEFPHPDRRQKRLIFQVCTSAMNLSPEVDLEDLVIRPERLSGADINAICQESGMLAVRKNRYVVLPRDLDNAYRKVIKKMDGEKYDFYS